MIGYILIGIGAWLVLDDWKIARAKKLKEGVQMGSYIRMAMIAVVAIVLANRVQFIKNLTGTGA